MEVLMRALFLAAAVMIPAPVLAAPQADAPVADFLPSPSEVDRYGAAFNGLVGALLGVDVGPLADAISPGRPGAGSRQTIGDLARRDDPDFDARLQGSTRALANSMGVLREQMHRLEPELRRSIEEFRRGLDEARRDRAY
jgi:hypothetical protein